MSFVRRTSPWYCRPCDFLFWDIRDRLRHEIDEHPKADPEPGVDDAWLRLPSGFDAAPR